MNVDPKKALIGALTGLLDWALTAALYAGIVQLLWNAAVPDLFSLPRLGFWKAMWLSLLCSLLFKSGPANGNSDRG